MTSSSGRRLLGRVVSSLVAAGLLAVPPVTTAMAHTPHDDIADVALSPAFLDDDIAFAISRGILLKSVDGGRSWRRVVRGLDNIGELVSLHLSPRQPDTLFLASDADGIYKSTDQGDSWARANTGLRTSDIRLVVSSPESSEIAFAAGGVAGLYGTSDGGSTWTAVPGAADLTVSSIAFWPGSESSLLYGDTEGGVHRSDDGGATWRSGTIEGAGPIRSIAVSPAAASDGTVFVGTDRKGIQKSTDGGSSFVPVNRGVTDPAIWSVVVSEDFDADSTVWASAQNDGVFTSVDGGAMWTRTSAGLEEDPQAGTPGYEDRPSFGSLSVSTSDGDGDGDGRTMLLAGFAGLFRSTDSGREWTEVETLASTILVGLAVSPDFARDATVAVTTYINGAFLSDDGGSTWTAINDGLEETTASVKGPDRVARLYGIAFSPAYASDRTLFSATSSKFLRSTDAGRTWSATVPEGTSTEDRPRQLTIAVSPAYAEDKTILLGDGSTGDVFLSTDGGSAFSKQGNVGRLIRSFVVSPEFATDDTLFAGTGHGVFQSIDRGATWAPLGLDQENVGSLAISPQFGADGTIMAGTLDGLYVTRDRGTTWRAPETPGTPPGDSIEAVAMSPSFGDDGTALVTARGRGLFRSTDGGETFSPVGNDLLERNQLLDTFSKSTASPIVFSTSFAADDTVFGFSGTELVKSTDGGETWAVETIPRTIRGVPATTPGREPSTSGLPLAASVAAVMGATALLVAGLVIVRRRRRPT